MYVCMYVLQMLDMYSEAYFDYCYMIRLQPEDGSIYSSRGTYTGRYRYIRVNVSHVHTLVMLS